MPGSLSAEHKKNGVVDGIVDKIAPLSLALMLFTSSARGQALQELPPGDPQDPRQPPVPTLAVDTSKPPFAVTANFPSLSSTNAAVAAELAADKALDPPVNKLGQFLTKVKEFAYYLAGQQTVDLIVVAVTTASVTIGSLWLGLAARRKLFPDLLSSYIVEPVPRANGFDEEYLSTRTVTGPDISLKSIYGCSPHLRKAVRRAEKYAKKHPELPILFFSSAEGPEILNLLRTATSSTLADSAHVQALVRSSDIRFKQAIEKITGTPPKSHASTLVPMEKVFEVFTFERYDSISARLVILPVKDVVSLLIDPERWFDSAHRLPVTQDRDAGLRRLVRQLEIATTLVIDRPDIFTHYLKGYDAVIDELNNSTTALRRMLLLRPNASLEYVEQWMSTRAKAKGEGLPMPRATDVALTPREQLKLDGLLCNTTANVPDPREIVPHAFRHSSTGAKPPYNYDRRSNWHAVIDIPSSR